MRKIRQFIREEKGAVFIIIALCSVSMVGITAASLDYSRGSLLRSEMVSALDSAALAGGTVANSANLDATVDKYFKVNLPVGYMGSTIDPVTTTLAADKSTLTVAASAHLKDAMMQTVNWNMTNITAASQVTIEKKGMELVLVLDNTGSMTATAGGGVTKLDALKTASTTLINIIYGNKTSIENLWVGLVPFSQAVNIGTGRTSDWVSGTSNYRTAGWSGCVEAREANNRDVTDDPPSVAPFPKYFAACFPFTGSYQTWWNAWYGTNTSSGPPPRTNCSTSTGMQERSGISAATYGPNQYCPQALTQMTASKTTILNGINSMQAVGDTHINLGLAWGWRLLSPRWRAKTNGTSWWGGEMAGNASATPPTPALPLDYRTPLMNKVIVLLSDGDNAFTSNNYTAYGMLSANRLGTTSSTTAADKLDTRTTQVCDSLKTNGVIIYTVALGTSISSDGKTLLKNCASYPEYYFESPTGADLQTAFTTIGDSLSNLRISQ